MCEGLIPIGMTPTLRSKLCQIASPQHHSRCDQFSDSGSYQGFPTYYTPEEVYKRSQCLSCSAFGLGLLQDFGNRGGNC